MMPLLSIVTTLTAPLLWLLETIHSVGLTWAWSIIVLTFIVRLALVPLTVKQQQSMRRMTALQPELKKLQAKYKHDRQMLNEKMMEFYRENNTNPFGSCLPILVQIPIFIGLFYLLRSPERFIEPGDDLSFLFGFIDDITTHLKDLPTSTLAILMVIYVSSQVGSMLLMPSTADPRMKYLFAGMPILFAVFIVNQAFPAGLMLYWITTNLWTLRPGGRDPPRLPAAGIRRDAGAGEGEEERRPTRRGQARGQAGRRSRPPRSRPRRSPSRRRRGRRSRAARAGHRSRNPSREVRPMSDVTTVEGTGETVGEAKWSALRELEKRFPGLDRQAVEFQVLSEGERGLMGIGREPARVVATLGATPTPEQRAAVAERRTEPREAREPRPARPRPAPVPAPVLGEESSSDEANEVREIVAAVAGGLGLGATLHVGETDEAVTATLSGGELGVVIGKHGKTIDAVQYLVNAIRAREGDAKPVVIDAQNYRRRRELALAETAERAARDAIRTGQPVALDPMTSVERKIVHLLLKERDDVETSSDGREPFRHIVVSPAGTAEAAPEPEPAGRRRRTERLTASGGCGSRRARPPRRAGRRTPPVRSPIARPARRGSHRGPAVTFGGHAERAVGGVDDLADRLLVDPRLRHRPARGDGWRRRGARAPRSAAPTGRRQRRGGRAPGGRRHRRSAGWRGRGPR